MTAAAIILMIIAMVTVWGGLVAAIVNLVRHPEAAETEPVLPSSPATVSPATGTTRPE